MRCEDEALAQRPLRQREGAGADRMLAEIGAELLDRFLGHDEGEVDRHDVEEGRVGAAELDLDGVGIDDLDARELVAEPSAIVGKARRSSRRSRRPGSASPGW